MHELVSPTALVQMITSSGKQPETGSCLFQQIKKSSFHKNDKQIVGKEKAEKQLSGLRAMKLLILSETTIARHGSTCKQNGAQRWRVGIGLMAGVGGHWIPMTK